MKSQAFDVLFRLGTNQWQMPIRPLLVPLPAAAVWEAKSSAFVSLQHKFSAPARRDMCSTVEESVSFATFLLVAITPCASAVVGGEREAQEAVLCSAPYAKTGDLSGKRGTWSPGTSRVGLGLYLLGLGAGVQPGRDAPARQVGRRAFQHFSTF